MDRPLANGVDHSGVVHLSVRVGGHETSNLLYNNLYPRFHEDFMNLLTGFKFFKCAFKRLEVVYTLIRVTDDENVIHPLRYDAN